MTCAPHTPGVHARPARTRRLPAASSGVESSLTLHGQVLRYLEAGRPGGAPALVLLHGLGSDRRTWRGVLPALSRHDHVFALDLLGFGASSKPRDGDYSVAAQAALVRDAVRALGLEQVSVIGHSFGGGV